MTISHVTVLECVVELVACLAAIEADENAFRWASASGLSHWMPLRWSATVAPDTVFPEGQRVSMVTLCVIHPLGTTGVFCHQGISS